MVLAQRHERAAAARVAAGHQVEGLGGVPHRGPPRGSRPRPGGPPCGVLLLVQGGGFVAEHVHRPVDARGVPGHDVGHGLDDRPRAQGGGGGCPRSDQGLARGEGPLQQRELARSVGSKAGGPGVQRQLSLCGREAPRSDTCRWPPELHEGDGASAEAAHPADQPGRSGPGRPPGSGRRRPRSVTTTLASNEPARHLLHAEVQDRRVGEEGVRHPVRRHRARRRGEHLLHTPQDLQAGGGAAARARPRE